LGDGLRQLDFGLRHRDGGQAPGVPLSDIPYSVRAMDIMMKTAFSAALLAALLLPGRAFAYAEPSHVRMTRLAAPSSLDLAQRPAACPGADELAAFRAWLDERLREDLPEELSKRLRARYPEPGSLADSMAMRAFLGHNAEQKEAGTTGIDLPLPCKPGASLLDVLADASAQPDYDRRNCDRYHRDEAGEVTKDRYGRPVPADPALLNMGSLGKLSSQAHAHYGLPEIEMSSDPEVLKSRPEAFALSLAWPDEPVRTFAHEQAQACYDLALLAIERGGEGARTLAMLHLGAALHYAQDVSNPLHNVQVGHYGFFVEAKLQSILESLKTAGGLLGDRRGFGGIGLTILTSHHLIAEEIADKILFAGTEGADAEPYPGYRVAPFEADLRRLLAAEADSGLLAAAQTAAPAAQLTRALALLGAPIGPALYRHTFAATAPPVHSGEVEVEGGEIELQEVLGSDAEAVLAEIAALDPLFRAAMARGVGASRLLISRFARDAALGSGAPPAARTEAAAALERFARGRLDALDAQDERRARYLASPPPPASTGVQWSFAVGELIALLLVALLGLRLLRRRGRARAQ